jgi:hypothetical protein
MEMNYRSLPNEDDLEKNALLSQYRDNTISYDIEENIPERPFKLPTFMLQENTCCNNFSKIICCQSKKFKIKQSELRAYYKLKEIALVSYDQTNVDHENCLKNLFITALNCDLTDNLETIEWKTLGFQVYFK